MNRLPPTRNSRNDGQVGWHPKYIGYYEFVSLHHRVMAGMFFPRKMDKGIILLIKGRSPVVMQIASYNMNFVTLRLISQSLGALVNNASYVHAFFHSTMHYCTAHYSCCTCYYYFLNYPLNTHSA